VGPFIGLEPREIFVRDIDELPAFLKGLGLSGEEEQSREAHVGEERPPAAILNEEKISELRLDVLFEDAARLTIGQESVDPSLFMDPFYIGEARAQRIISQLHTLGILKNSKDPTPWTRTSVFRDEAALEEHLREIASGKPEQKEPDDAYESKDAEEEPTRVESTEDLEKRKQMYIASLFKGNKHAYNSVIDRLARAHDWAEAHQIIAEDVFRAFEVNIYSVPAIMFTDEIERYFDEGRREDIIKLKYVSEDPDETGPGAEAIVATTEEFVVGDLIEGETTLIYEDRDEKVRLLYIRHDQSGQGFKFKVVLLQ